MLNDLIIPASLLFVDSYLQMRKVILKRLSPGPGATASNGRRMIQTRSSGLQSLGTEPSFLLLQTREALSIQMALLLEKPSLKSPNWPSRHFHPRTWFCPLQSHSARLLPPLHGGISDDCREPCWSPYVPALGGWRIFVWGLLERGQSIYILLLAIPTEQHEGINLEEKGFNTGSCIFITFSPS